MLQDHLQKIKNKYQRSNDQWNNGCKTRVLRSTQHRIKESL